MFIRKIDELDPFIPGLVIKPDGSIITMENENHATFFQNIIGNEYRKMGFNVRSLIGQNNLEVLMMLLLDQLNILPYQGCESKTRIHNEGILYINELDDLTNEQLLSIINIYNVIETSYKMAIKKVGKNNEDDKFVTIDDITNELNKKNGSIKK